MPNLHASKVFSSVLIACTSDAHQVDIATDINNISLDDRGDLVSNSELFSDKRLPFFYEQLY